MDLNESVDNLAPSVRPLGALPMSFLPQHLYTFMYNLAAGGVVTAQLRSTLL